MRSALLLAAPLAFVVACDGATPATSAEDTLNLDSVSDAGDVSPDLCDGFACTPNSHCVEVDATPTCTCDEGFLPVDALCVADNPTAPAIDNLPATSTGASGTSTTFTVVAVDINAGDTLTFSRASSTCTFDVVVSQAGEVIWTCPAAFEFCAVTIEVMDQDGLTDSEVLDIVCPNGVPSVTDVAVSPDPIPFLGTTLVCDYAFNDPEGDDDTSTIEWLIAGSVVSTELTFAAYVAFDDIQCRVTPRDPNGSGAAVTSPVVTAPESRITAITAGLSHTCAAVDNRVACWGRNVRGALGDNTTTDRPSPAYITLGDQHFDSVGSIAAGDEHSCAIMDGSLKCWGSNSHGQLGVSGFGQQLVLVEASGQPMTGVSAGKAFTCAISNARGTCSGLDSDGQLGDGTNVNANGFRLGRGPASRRHPHRGG